MDQKNPANDLIAFVLNNFPEVTWDRWGGETDGHCNFFGWITRGDGRFEFIVINFSNGVPWYFCTSSAEYSEDFGRRLGCGNGTTGKHHPCKRIEDAFPWVNNVVHLK